MVVLPSAGDKLAVKLADQVEFNLEDNEDVALESRDTLLDALDKQDPFGERNLESAMDTTGVEVLARVVKQKGSTYGVILYDRAGLDVDTFEVGNLKGASDAKAVGAKAAKKVAASVSAWKQKRKARLARRDEQRRKEEAEEKKKRDQKRTVWAADDAGDEDLPPPPETDPDEKPRRGGRVVAGLDDEEPPARPEPRPERPVRKEKEVPKAAAPKKAGNSRVVVDDPPAEEEDVPPPPSDPDEPSDDVPVRKKKKARPPPPKPKYSGPYKGALARAENEQKEEAFTPMNFVKNLYTLNEPSPYFIASVGPEIAAWSYSLWEKSGRRRASTCSPQTKPKFSFSCTPHGGANLWLEAWPIRYLGLEANVRLAGTRYPAAISQQTLRPVTDQGFMWSALLGGHVAAKARFVLTFGPIPGAAVGVRVRLGYSRNLVTKQTPFTAVPGYHAATLGGGVEGYLPLLWKHLSFDARAEFIPLVFYQEVAGIALEPREFILPKSTLNNPGANARTVGWRVDAGVRGVAFGGFLLELRLFNEGYYAVFEGVGNRTDANLNRITYGRTLNLTFGLSLAVGWLFPKGLKPLYGSW
jgi:hypothetical protein